MNEPVNSSGQDLDSIYTGKYILIGKLLVPFQNWDKGLL